MSDKSTFDVYRKISSESGGPPGICLVSHNVFWFQGVPFATDTPSFHRSKIVTQLASLYREINPDVICLQELQNRDAAAAVAKELEMKYIFRSGGSYPQYGGVVLSRWPMEEIALPQGFVPDRILISVKIFPDGAQAFQLANIHLPSNRQRGAEGSQTQRLRELSLVMEHADILLGDFNERPDGQCAALLKKEGFVDAAEVCGAGELSSNIGTYRGDQIWLSGKKADALQGYFVIPKERLAINDGEKKFLSDHLPVGCLLNKGD